MAAVPPLPLDVIPDPRLGIAASAVSLKDTSRSRWWLSLFEGVLFGLLLFVGSWLLLGQNGFIGAWIGYCLTWAWLCVTRTGRVRRRIATLWTSPPYRLSIDEGGVLAASEGGTYGRSWNRMSKLVVQPKWVALYSMVSRLSPSPNPPSSMKRVERLG